MTALVILVVLAALPWAAGRRADRLGDPALGVGRVPGGTAEASHPRAMGVLMASRGGAASGVPGRRWRRRHAVRSAEADPALLLDLVAVALAAGAPVPGALRTVGVAWPGGTGEALVRAARALELGAPWDVAWTGAGASARLVAGALEPAWSAGASPVPLLRTAADRLRSRRRAETRAAAGRLGVQLVVPLTLCYLPAFVLVGLVPVVVSLAAGLLG